MPRANEHVHALHQQYEGLQDTIAELEETLKRVSSVNVYLPGQLTELEYAAAFSLERESICRGVQSGRRVGRPNQTRTNGDLCARADSGRETCRGEGYNRIAAMSH